MDTFVTSPNIAFAHSNPQSITQSPNLPVLADGQFTSAFIDHNPPLPRRTSSINAIVDGTLLNRTQENPAEQQNGSRKHKRRKLSQAVNRQDSNEGEAGLEVDAGGYATIAGGQGSPQQRKQRACDQCKQQKLRCNLVEDPYTPCDRCKKFGHTCRITDDFKRIAKRTQLTDLERQVESSLEIIADREQSLADKENALVERDERIKRLELQIVQSGQTPITMVDDGTYGTLLTGPLGENLLPSLASNAQDPSQDAQLLLQLKQGQVPALPLRQGNPTMSVKILGTFSLSEDIEVRLWQEFFSIYHRFLPILDEQQKNIDAIYKRNPFLFWTVMIIALRHFSLDQPTEGVAKVDNLLFRQLLPNYRHLIRDVICTPPKDYLTVKGLCLICHWPLPIENTEQDLTQVLSGLMMKHAMQLGLHRPSNPDDFSRSKTMIRKEDIIDRLRTWAVCTLVAQDISTGYGQPPDTVYDATLSNSFSSTPGMDFTTQSDLHLRMEIEKLANQVTRDLYLPKDQPDAQVTLLVDAIIPKLKELEISIGAAGDNPLDVLDYKAACLHLWLHVFFGEHNTERYQSDLFELYTAAASFLESAFGCGYDLRYAPNYIMQMMFAAAAALLKLLTSSRSDQLAALGQDRTEGAQLFWRTITQVRQMTVQSNDLPLRLAEVFAQMWNASDFGNLDPQQLEGMDEHTTALATAAAAAAMAATNADIGDDIKPAVGSTVSIDLSDLKLKRKARQSMSVVYDSIWRWKEDMKGNKENLESSVRNPTSPQQLSARPGSSATNHRGSFSNMSSGRRPSDLIAPHLSGEFQNMYSGFEGYSEFELFDPLSWALQAPYLISNTPPPQGMVQF